MKQVIDPKDLDHLIRWHQDNTSSYAYLMSPSVRYLEDQTVKVLEHYRNIIVTTPKRRRTAVNPNG
ncbi:hypothetical protein ES705_34738 [subsurface metagenome]